MKDEEIQKIIAVISKRLGKIELEFRSFIDSLNYLEVAGGIITSSSDADLDPNLKSVMQLSSRLVRIERKLQRFEERMERLEKMML
jgi:hypothetical protein